LTINVLVTGATGFIGRNLVERLIERGYFVRIYSRHSYLSFPSPPVEKSSWFTGGLEQSEKLEIACRGIDFVFHVAGLSHTNTQLNDAIRVNAVGCKNVYNASLKAGVKKFVFFSSILASRPSESNYAASKYSAEEFLFSVDKACVSTHPIILRVPYVYGPDMKGNMGAFIRFASRGRMPSLSNFARTFPLISVGDLCKAAADIVESDLAAAPTGIFELSDGQEYTVDRIEKAIYRALGRSQPRWKIPKWIYYLASCVAEFANNTGLKKNQLGFNLYRNLNRQPQTSEQPSVLSYEFNPADTLESEMPAIIASLNNQK
jgi:nucleoside-diphosphate-sugar epimerase